ncbi:MAG: hypothetical protein DHS80DRAFT_29105 [Piptocephalis tieghemiana]|nr:MAG: hypothetical protein DHS80DRAFT_29105 [Piptocephalis tieghemiana]
MYPTTLLAITLPLMALLSSQTFADITFTSPTESQYAVQNSSLKVAWTYTDPVPNRISLKISNVNNVPFQGKLAIGTVSPADRNYTYNHLPESWTGDGWVIHAEDAAPSANTTSATSYGTQSFVIKPIGTAPPASNSDTKSGDAKSTATTSSLPMTQSVLVLTSGSLLASLVLVF